MREGRCTASLLPTPASQARSAVHSSLHLALVNHLAISRTPGRLPYMSIPTR